MVWEDVGHQIMRGRASANRGGALQRPRDEVDLRASRSSIPPEKLRRSLRAGGTTKPKIALAPGHG